MILIIQKYNLQTLLITIDNTIDVIGNCNNVQMSAQEIVQFVEDGIMMELDQSDKNIIQIDEAVSNNTQKD